LGGNKWGYLAIPRTGQAGLTRVLELLDRGMGIKPPQIRAMTMASFAEFGVVRDGNHPVIACPKCLGVPIPFYRLTSCLEFVTVCAISYVELQKSCPACGTLIRFAQHFRVNQVTCYLP
jgi:hypothetical protein